MAKSYKLKDDNYIDSGSISHNRKSLKEVLGVVLYEDDSGTKSNITLSDSADKYSYIEIFFDIPNGFKSVKVYNPNNKTVVLNGFWFDSHLRFYMKKVNIVNNAINNQETKTFTIQNSTTWTPYGSNADNINIYKVVGYK